MEKSLEQLHAFVKDENIGEAVRLFECNPELGIRLYKGRMLAHAAAALGQMNLVWYLAEHQPELMYLQDQQGNTPAHLAAKAGHIDTFMVIRDCVPSSLAIRNREYSSALPGGECVSDCCLASPVFAQFAPVAQREEKDIRDKALAEIPDAIKNGNPFISGVVETVVSQIPESQLKSYCHRHRISVPENNRNARRFMVANPAPNPFHQ